MDTKFYRTHDIDPTVVTTKVGYYTSGIGGIDLKFNFVVNPPGWCFLCGEYWFSRKSSNFIYRPHLLYDNTPQPDADWLADNRPSIKDLRRYGDTVPA